MKVAIVGAGIMGASAARFLSNRGHEVTVFEQFPLLHRLGSSHGRSRIVRKAYADPFYTEIAAEAYPLWAELQSQSNLDILFETGLLYFGLSSSENMTSQIQALESLSIPHTVCRGRDAARFVPGLVLEQNEIGIFSPDGGWVNAENAVEASIDLAKAAGASFTHLKVPSLEVFFNDPKYSFDRFVVCAGSWLPSLLNELLDELRSTPSPPFSVTLQSFFYLKGFRGGSVWIEDSANNVYGFPSEPDTRAYKISAHFPDRPFDPNSLNRETNSELETKLRDFARRRFRDVASEVVESGTCLYTNEPNENFKIGRIGERGIFASPCSGHGFKFGPWIGRLLADIVEGNVAPDDYPRFMAN